MTQDEIIEMAQQSGLGFYLEPQWQLHEEVIAFAKLVAQHEREACAKVCLTEWSTLGQMEAGEAFARAIRARGNT